jgi:hypothetical protein
MLAINHVVSTFPWYLIKTYAITNPWILLLVLFMIVMLTFGLWVFVG